MILYICVPVSEVESFFFLFFPSISITVVFTEGVFDGNLDVSSLESSQSVVYTYSLRLKSLIFPNASV